jgi:type II restriction enzyme
VNLQATVDLARGFRSPSQVARVITENWCRTQLYCLACDGDELAAEQPNSRACDFTCPTCTERYELKSSKAWSRDRIIDAGYAAMLGAIQADRTPNLLVMQYSENWLVRNLLLIPRYFLTESVIEKRTPLGPLARRAGWVGCNILLRGIPDEGKIGIVENGIESAQNEVRERFRRTKPLLSLSVTDRGWTLDVLSAVRSIGRQRFSLADAYTCEERLSRLYPNNRHVRAKIRQQLQVLRDLGFLQFLGNGQYRFLGGS